MLPYIVCIVGPGRKTGKTTLVEGLVKRLTEKDRRVATIKHAHGSFDTPKKDSWRHLQAGASSTGVITDTESLIIWNNLPPTPEALLDKFPKNLDYVIIEGFRHSPYPKIIVADIADDLKSIDLDDVVAISGRIVENQDELKKLTLNAPIVKINETEKLADLLEAHAQMDLVKQLPGSDCKACGYDSCDELANAVLKGEANIKQCITLFTKVDLTIDGKKIVMKGFVQNLLKAAVLGVVKELKEIPEKIREIDVHVRLD
jgi:molybdopterin-guanine dinucleotide biosynthesis protein B